MMNNELENIRSRFKNYLPEFILKAPYLNEVFNSEIIESYYLNKYAKELLNELSILTVTENSINKWENFTGLRNENLSIEERINSVVKKFSFQIHANYFNFLTLLKTYDDTTELKEFIDEYRIEIKTKNYISYNDFLNYLSIISNYKPAHIGVSVEVNREYEMKYYMDNMIINEKLIHTEVNVNAPNNLDINNCVGIILNNEKSKNISIENNNCNNYFVSYSMDIVIQKYKHKETIV